MSKRRLKYTMKDDEILWVLVQYTDDGIISDPLKFHNLEHVDGNDDNEELEEGDNCLAPYADGKLYPAKIMLKTDDKEQAIKDRKSFVLQIGSDAITREVKGKKGKNKKVKVSNEIGESSKNDTKKQDKGKKKEVKKKEKTKDENVEAKKVLQEEKKKENMAKINTSLNKAMEMFGVANSNSMVKKSSDNIHVNPQPEPLPPSTLPFQQSSFNPSVPVQTSMINHCYNPMSLTSCPPPLQPSCFPLSVPAFLSTFSGPFGQGSSTKTVAASSSGHASNPAPPIDQNSSPVHAITTFNSQVCASYPAPSQVSFPKQGSTSFSPLTEPSFSQSLVTQLTTTSPPGPLLACRTISSPSLTASYINPVTPSSNNHDNLFYPQHEEPYRTTLTCSNASNKSTSTFTFIDHVNEGCSDHLDPNDDLDKNESSEVGFLAMLSTPCNYAECAQREQKIKALEEENYLLRKEMASLKDQQRHQTDDFNVAVSERSSNSYTPKTGMNIEKTDYVTVDDPTNPVMPPGYQLLVPGFQLALPTVWLTTTLRKLRKKNGSTVYKKLIDGIMSPWDLNLKGGSKALNGSKWHPVIQSLEAYGTNVLKMTSTEVTRALNEKLFWARRIVKKIDSR